jgi:hypothetical protein
MKTRTKERTKQEIRQKKIELLKHLGKSTRNVDSNRFVAHGTAQMEEGEAEVIWYEDANLCVMLVLSTDMVYDFTHDEWTPLKKGTEE